MPHHCYYDHLTEKHWDALAHLAQSSQDVHFLHSPDGSKHRIKSEAEQRSLELALKKMWLGYQQTEYVGLAKVEATLAVNNIDWLFAQAKRRVLGSKTSAITTVKEAMAILENIQNHQIIHGRSLTPYEYLVDTKVMSKISEDSNVSRLVSQVLRYCLSDPSLSTRDLARILPLGKLIRGGNEEMNEAACRAYDHVFQKLIEQLQTDETLNKELAHVVIENMLALLPYFEPKEGRVFTIPTLINGEWIAINYTVERLQISSKDYPFSPYYAYGLMPPKDESGLFQAPAHLAFMGTTYPAASGGFFTILADTHPFKSVGMWAFEQGKDVIEAFLKKAQAQTGKKTVLTGQSLGACMSLHTATGFADLVSQAHAFSPTALLARDLVKWDQQAEQYLVLPDVQVYRQRHDMVPMFGNTWGHGWQINYVNGFDMTGPVEGHIRVGTAARQVTIARIQERVRPSLRRSLLAALKVVAGGIIFAIGQLMIWLKQAQVALTFTVSQLSLSFKIKPTAPVKAGDHSIHAAPLLVDESRGSIVTIA